MRELIVMNTRTDCHDHVAPIVMNLREPIVMPLRTERNEPAHRAS